MNHQLLHTPDGVRDIYNGECARKQALQNKMHRVMKVYGYQDIETPSFEFFDVFGTEVGTTPSKELFKFFDKEGNTLVLRPDFTPSIARAYSKYFSQEDMPIRLSYLGNAFINNSNLQGRLKETTQLGAELIGDDSVTADAEIAAMIVETLLKAGLNDFQVSIGQVDFYRSLMDEAGMDEGSSEELKRLITNKNIFGVETFMEEMNMGSELKEIFKNLPQMFGSIDVIEKAEQMTANKKALAALERLKELYEILKNYGYERYISFDLGMLGNYMYYTGVVFRAYTFGTGEAVVRGGRYNELLKHFGKSAPSIGFVVLIDQLQMALSRQKIAVEIEAGPVLFLYEPNMRDTAIQAAMLIRRQGRSAMLMERDGKKALEDYCDYAKRTNLLGITYFEENGNAKALYPTGMEEQA